MSRFRAVPDLAALIAAAVFLALPALTPAFADTTTQTLGTLPASQANPPAAMQAAPTPNAPAGAPAYYANPGSAATYSRADAVPDNSVLQQMQSGDIVYVTGGIGDEERDALDAAKKDYNLHVLNASAGGAFKGDTQVVIKNMKGDQLLSAAVGPILLAKVPAGTYVVESSSGGATKTQKVKVGRSSTGHVHFIW